MDQPPFTIKVEPHTDRNRRFRWGVYDTGRLLDNSLQSFATVREARADAENFVRALVNKRRTIQLQTDSEAMARLPFAPSAGYVLDE